MGKQITHCKYRKNGKVETGDGEEKMKQSQCKTQKDKTKESGGRDKDEFTVAVQSGRKEWNLVHVSEIGRAHV